MDALPMLSIKFVFLIVFSYLPSGYTEDCFKFQEEKKNYALFNVTDWDLSNSAEFNLTFRTRKPHGMIFYIEGKYSAEAPYDFESLYVRDGKLNHLVFNPEPTGIGSSFGSHVITDFDVNTGENIQVNFFRRKEFPVDPHDLDNPAHLEDDVRSSPRTSLRSGFVVNGTKYTTLPGTFPLDLKNKAGDQFIWIGGAIPSRGLEPFDGVISDIVNVVTDQKFDSPDIRSLVLPCDEDNVDETGK